MPEPRHSGLGEDRQRAARPGNRPRSKAFLRFSRENPYAQIGVSPLAPTDEIATRISTLISEARKRVNARGSKTEDDPDQKLILRLQKIDEQIGDPKRRKAYDEKYPQDALLAVQPSAAERTWLRYRKAGLISEWLSQELGEAAFLPAPSCPRLWTPSGLESKALDFLCRFLQWEPEPRADAAAAGGPEEPLMPDLSAGDLERILKDK